MSEIRVEYLSIKEADRNDTKQNQLCEGTGNQNQAGTFSVCEELYTKGPDIVVKRPKRERAKNLVIIVAKTLKNFIIYILT